MENILRGRPHSYLPSLEIVTSASWQGIWMQTIKKQVTHKSVHVICMLMPVVSIKQKREREKHLLPPPKLTNKSWNSKCAFMVSHPYCLFESAFRCGCKYATLKCTVYGWQNHRSQPCGVKMETACLIQAWHMWKTKNHVSSTEINHNAATIKRVLTNGLEYWQL